MLGKLARQHDPNVLVGFDYADDAGVYQIAPDQALVQTVDFFTPVVDDPYTFGQIAATNSLSDVYAMGGKPLTALALVCFPEKADLEILEQILAGGLSKMVEAGCTVIGGHSIRDEETKFGYSVTGLIHPGKVLANRGARPGDALVLTKALGTGVISTAIKKGKANQEWIDAAVRSMTTLNKAAAEVITRNPASTTAHLGTAAQACPERSRRARPAEYSSASTAGSERGRAALEGREKRSTKAGALAPEVPANDQRQFSACPERSEGTDDGFSIHAMTDITGFGLIGHAREMALASDVSLEIQASKIPLLEGALECVRGGYIPGGLKNNRDFAECAVECETEVPDDVRALLFDPQTAGGLLISVASKDAADLIQALNAAEVNAIAIGTVLPRTTPLIKVTA